MRVTRLTIDCHIPNGLCSSRRWSIRSGCEAGPHEQRLDPRGGEVRPGGGVRRGDTSARRRCAPASCRGSARRRAASPPGASQVAIRVERRRRIVEVLEHVPHRHGVDRAGGRSRVSTRRAERRRRSAAAAARPRSDGSIPTASNPAPRRDHEPAAAGADVEQPRAGPGERADERESPAVERAQDRQGAAGEARRAAAVVALLVQVGVGDRLLFAGDGDRAAAAGAAPQREAAGRAPARPSTTRHGRRTPPHAGQVCTRRTVHLRAR